MYAKLFQNIEHKSSRFFQREKQEIWERSQNLNSTSLSIILHAERQWNDEFKVLAESYFPSRILYASVKAKERWF